LTVNCTNWAAQVVKVFKFKRDMSRDIKYKYNLLESQTEGLSEVNLPEYLHNIATSCTVGIYCNT